MKEEIKKEINITYEQSMKINNVKDNGSSIYEFKITTIINY